MSKNSAWLTAYTYFPDTMQAPPIKIFKWGHGKFNEVTSLSSDSHWKWMHFVNDQVGFMANDSLYQTRNGGRTWSIVKLPGLSQFKGNINYPFQPFFFHSHDGILVASIGQVSIKRERNILYSTNNNGLTWIKTGNFPIQSWNYGLFFLNQRNGWTWSTENGYLYQTVNHGQTWTKKFTNLSFKNVSHLQFITARIGYAIVENNENVGQLMKTLDGGAYWIKIK